jgi:hypothetical protein
MDDTACTNHFNLPLVVIIGVDENGRNQVVAFAFLFDRCAERFTDFLQWLFERMESTPLAFVVDRHEGQAKAIRTVFPTARIIYCAKHLGQNISALFGRHYQVVRTFWRLIRLEVEEADWIALLVAVAAHFEGGTPERRMINWLLENMDHYCPERIFELSGEQVSSRVEGFFGVLKQRIEHLLLTLLDLATEIRLLAQECLAKRLLPRRRPFCGADILATEDQMCIGASAARRLQEEVKKLRTWDWYADQSERRAMTVGICCGIARRWKLPCIHLLLSRTDAKKTPLLTLDDFPEWVKLAPLNLGLHGVHEVGTLDIHSSLRAPRCDRNEILAALEPLVNAAVRGCPHAQECIADVLQRFNRRPQVEAGDIFIDPVRTAGPGRQNVHPGLASLLAVMRPPKKAARTDGPAKRFCSYCHGAGHDRRNCPLRLEHEQQGS